MTIRNLIHDLGLYINPYSQEKQELCKTIVRRPGFLVKCQYSPSQLISTGHNFETQIKGLSLAMLAILHPP